MKVCTETNHCVSVHADLKWLKRVEETGIGYHMVTMLIFDENLRLEKAVDATRLILDERIKFGESGSISHRITSFNTGTLTKKFVLDNSDL